MDLNGVRVWITTGEDRIVARMYDAKVSGERSLASCYIAGNPGGIFAVNYEDSSGNHALEAVDKWHVSLLKCSVSVDGGQKIADVLDVDETAGVIDRWVSQAGMLRVTQREVPLTFSEGGDTPESTKISREHSVTRHRKITVDICYIHGCMASGSQCAREECNGKLHHLPTRRKGGRVRFNAFKADLPKYPAYRFVFYYAPLDYLIANGKALAAQQVHLGRTVCNLGCSWIEDAFFYKNVMERIRKEPENLDKLSPAKKAFYLELKERRKECNGCKSHRPTRRVKD